MAVSGGVGGAGQNTSGRAGGNSSAAISLTSGFSVGATVITNDPNDTGAGEGQGGDVISGNGNGGAGGAATASVMVSTVNANNPFANAEVYGGGGGIGRGSGFSGGVGGPATVSNASGTSASGKVGIFAGAVGGNGGEGVSGASGGNGADANVLNAAGGSTSGELDLQQTATGGAGGDSDGGHAGAGGNGSSSLTFAQNGIGLLSGVVTAGGGSGGETTDNNGATGAAGGAATATINLTGNGAIMATATAIPAAAHGGYLGSGLNGFTAGAGGSSTASATGSRTGSLVGADSVTVHATATGQPGGIVPTNLAIPLLGSGGNGGAASATAVANGNGPDTVNATATATGGDGGSGNGSGFQYGNGGNATANATATSTAGGAFAYATAQGGSGSYGYVGGVGTANLGITGVSTANASATGVGFAVANADATELPPILLTNTFSTASATARATGSGLYSFVQGLAVAPPDFAETACSLGTINSPNHATAFPITASVNSVATVAAAPLAGDVTGAWALDSNVRNALNNAPANVNALLLAYMLYAPNGTGLSHDYSSVLEINENNAQLTGNGLVVGLLTTQLTGAGLQSGDSLRFRIKRQGITLVDQTFSTNPALLTYLQNSVFDLGVQNAGLNGANLDVQFLFDLTTTHPGSGIGEQFVVGNDSNAQIGVWNNAAGGSWASPTNWSASTLPDGPGVQATFGSVITMPQTVTLDESTTVGNLQFNNQTSYTIAQGAGGGSLILDNAGAAAIINVSAGNHSISAPISIGAAGVNVSVADGDLLTVSGSISGTGGIIKSAAGTLLLSGVNSYGGVTSVNGGTLVVNGSISGAVAVNSTGTLQGIGTIGGLVTVNSGGILSRAMVQAPSPWGRLY